MFIGNLSRKAAITYTLTRWETGKEPAVKTAGNPFLGQKMLVGWTEIMDDGISMTVEMGAPCFISDICIALGTEGAPYEIVIRTADRTRVLARYGAETGEKITASKAVLTVGEAVESFVIDFALCFSALDVDAIDIYGTDSTERIPQFPIPNINYEKEGALPLSAITAYVADCKDSRAAAAVFAEKFAEQTGRTLSEADAAALHFRYDPALTENGYRVVVTEASAFLYARDLRGFVMAGENLLKRIVGDSIPAFAVKDAPRMPLRGVHMYLPGTEEMEFARRLVKYLLSPLGYNAVIMELGGGMRYESHPEINDALLEVKRRTAAGEWPAYPHVEVGGKGIVEKADVAAFADYIRSFGIDVIPEVQSLGHVQYLTIAHPEIAELEEGAVAKSVDELSADVPPDQFYPHSYCPSNEKSYEIVFDLLEEILDTVRPQRYVHMGHDEVYQIGVCPRCKDKDPAELYAADVCRYHEYLTKKGLRMMIWADMLQPVTIYKTPRALQLIPKDVILLDFIWYFHLEKDIETHLLKNGFNVGIGNLYSSHFPRYEERIVQPGIMGGQLSFWVGNQEEVLGREGKIYDLIYTAQMLWSASYTKHLRCAYDQKIKSLIPAVRNQLRGESPLTGEETVLLSAPVTFPDVKAEPVDCIVNTHCDALIFTHTASRKCTRIPWIALTVIANYEITYEDGSTVLLPVSYGGNISHWARRQNQPFPDRYYRHNGYSGTYFTDGIESKTADGTPVTLYRWEWRNPNPEKAIRRVRLIPEKDANTEVVLTALSGVNCR